MNPLNLVIELSDLLESTGYEGEPIALLFDEEIFPAIRHLNEKADPIGLGDRFGKVLDKVQASLNTHGTDRVRTLKDMMKSSLITYVRATHDAVTAREMYHRAIMSGSDTMLTVTAATILANALSGQHQDEAKMLIQQVASRLSGKQPRIPSMESASASAVGSGAIAVAAKGMKKKIRRRDSIFAEGDRVTWDDLIGNPTILDILREISEQGNSRPYDGVLVDPVTAELVLNVHQSLTKPNQQRYESRSLTEMIKIAHRAVERGLIEVVMQEA